MRYRRYTPSYRPLERWRQTTINVAWLWAYFAARDELQRTGKPLTIPGFGGWKLGKVVDTDFGTP